MENDGRKRKMIEETEKVLFKGKEENNLGKIYGEQGERKVKP